MWEISAVWLWKIVPFFTLTYNRQLSPKLSIIWEVCCPRDKSTNCDKWSTYPVIWIHWKWKWTGTSGDVDDCVACKKSRFHGDRDLAFLVSGMSWKSPIKSQQPSPTLAKRKQSVGDFLKWQEIFLEVDLVASIYLFKSQWGPSSFNWICYVIFYAGKQWCGS